ncbi:conjugal transfer protein [Streptomyces sp. NBC_00233]|uniref:conjugal transfer protein n=1 Tax=Streptomyces sp. NBC_00233 TaxID=2975686 RepID=UPI0022597E23|nr:conjugal transfer protein [Streptomyces sp. NBC_00233]MCX5227451.1 conjugal transfer protein [Streptomyces sp. NBC_00233]
MSAAGKELSRLQRIVLGAAFVPMLATGGAGGYGTYSNIKAAFGSGTAVGAVAAGEGATAVLAIVLLGLTLLGQSSPRVIRAGLWALPAAASAMSVTAAATPGEMVIYAITPMGMTASAEGAAFLARRIVVYRDGRDAEAEAHAAAIVQALAYHRARAANHPDKNVRAKSERTSWKLARKVGAGDIALGDRLLDVQRQRVTAGADAALADMFGVPTTPTPTAGPDGVTVELEIDRSARPIDSANAEKSTHRITERSTSDLPVPALTPAPVTPSPYDLFAQEEPAPGVGEKSTGRAAVMAADKPVRRRATGRVPQVARSVQPRRTKDELLAEARQLTESWPVEQLTADGIRKALRTSPEKGRWLRDTLKGERGEAA